MEEKSILREGYEKLSSTGLKFLEYVKETPGCLNRSSFREIKWEDDPISPAILQPWPIFISREMRDRFKEASTKIFALIRSIPQRIFANDTIKMSHYFDLPADQLERFFYGTDEEYLKYLIGRGDFVFSPSGLKCLEFNVASNFGGWEICIWQPMYLKNTVIDGFIKKNNVEIINKNLLFIYFSNFIGAALKYFPHDDEINIVLQTWGGLKDGFSLSMETYLNSIYQEVLTAKSQTSPLRGKVILAGFSDLDLKREHLYYRDNRIHVLIEYIKGEDIPPEILILYKFRKVLLYDGPVNMVMNNKLHLALLSEYRNSDLFTAEEREIIKEYIPWTRKLCRGSTTYGAESVHLEDFVISHREKLVIKPAKGTAGGDVYIGHRVPQSQWEEIVSMVFRDEQAWVVQEYIESYPFLFQAGENGCGEYNVILGMFVFGSYYGGVWARLLPREDAAGVISVGSGAQETIVLEIEE